MNIDNEFYKSIIETAHNGFWMVDLEGRILQVNRAYCEISGYCKEELLKMNVWDIEITESASDTAAHIKKLVRIGKEHFYSKHLRKDGSVIDVENNVQFIKKKKCFVGFIRDITERKRVEEALR